MCEEYDASDDSESFSDSSDTSLYNDIDNLIDTCHELHANIIIANDVLSNIKDKINRLHTINIIYDGVKMDFHELLESLHKEALENIEKGRTNMFEDQLIKSIHNSVFV